MKRAAYAAIGAAVGSAVLWTMVFAVGFVLQELGMPAYASEADQQRNFNVVIAAWIVAACVGGWMGFRKARSAGG